MQRKGFKEGWAVVDPTRGVMVNTVGETRRAAIVNWLVVAAGQRIYNHQTDQHIDSLWDAHRGASTVQTVRIYVD